MASVHKLKDKWYRREIPETKFQKFQKNLEI